jgi:glycosyltransferase involved in cell wall biosynthesis
MNNKVLASVGIITYNQENFIGQTIESILNQQCDFPFEIVIGEDSSTDNTRNIILEFQKKYPDIIKLVPKDSNKGVVKNFIDTFKATSGKYFAFCSGDDYWHDPLKLQKQVTFLENNPEYGLVHTDVNYYHQKNGMLIKNYNAKRHPSIDEENVFESLLTFRYFVNSATVCYVRSIAEQYIEFDKFVELKFPAEDYPVLLELSKRTKFKYFKESTATYRVIESSVSRPSNAARKFDFLKSVYSIQEYYINKFGVSKEMAEKAKVSNYKLKFELACMLVNYPVALEVYNFLKKEKASKLAYYFKLRLLRFPSIYKFAVKAKQYKDHTKIRALG